MKALIGSLCMLSLWLGMPSILAQSFPLRQPVPIIPEPKQVKREDQSFQASTILLSVPEKEGLIRQQLEQAFSASFSEVRMAPTSAKANVRLGIVDQTPGVQAHFQEIGRLPSHKQGYVLHIEPEYIWIMGGSEQGLFYGVQSLRQLLRAGKLPCLRINDWPSLPYRGNMDDISRGPIPTMEFMKAQIRRYSELKLNLMSCYVEHVVRTDEHPSLAPAEGISLAEWQELSEYARPYHVQLVGSFQSLGHFRNILQHPSYQALGVTDRMLEPGAPAALAFLKEIYADMAPAFSSDLFNLNGDEAWDLSRGKLKPLADSMGVAGVYAQHMLPLIQAVSDLGKRPTIWADIVLAHPELLEQLPKETILLTWEYGAKNSFAELIDPIKAAGFSFMVCPGVLNSNRLTPELEMATVNIQNFVNEGYEKGAMGMFNTVWDDGGRHFFSRDWYGVAYAADQAWHPNRLPIEPYDQRFDRAIYGDQSESFSALIHRINDLADLAPTQELNDQILESQLLPPRDSRNSLNLQDWETVQVICEEAQDLLKQMPPTAYQEDLAYWQYTIDLYAYLAEARFGLIRAANAYRNACLQQADTRETARREVQVALGEVMELNQLLRNIRSDFLRLWLQENRSYWLDHALGLFDEQLADFAEAEELLQAAIQDLDRGLYLPPPSEVRLAISEQKGQYFRYWLTLGSFPIEQLEGRKPDFLTAAGGEAHVRPIPGETVAGPDGLSLMWDKTYSEQMAVVDLLPRYARNTEATMYAYCRIHSDREQLVKASFGSNDGMAIFCNGEVVFETYAKRSLIPDEDEVMLPLKAGNNHLLLKVDQWKGDWGFSFRLPEVSVRNHKQTYQIVE
ncbi:MAG: beta-N-acetylhexosaminidase [Bacteroidota bacterium]